MGELIRVTQLPVIEEELRAMKASVEEAVANAKALACTPETIQTLKAVRTELRKRFDELERQRIAVKRAVMGPYDAFEVVYKECVSVLYQEADADLKKKIFATESSIKLACEDRLRTYYSELCAVHRVDFVPFEKAGITVDMASAKAKTPTRLMKQLSEFVERVAADVELIEKLEADGVQAVPEHHWCHLCGPAPLPEGPRGARSKGPAGGGPTPGRGGRKEGPGRSHSSPTAAPGNAPGKRESRGG